MGEENKKKDTGTVEEQRIWRRRTNEELGVLYKDLDVVTDIKRRDWNGLDMQ